MKEVHCAFHPNQVIVNFCRNSQCMLPMCPTCVKIHSTEHQKQSTYGIYQNINDVYDVIHQDLRNVLKNLIDYSQDIQYVCKSKQQKRQTISNKMAQMRKRFVKHIEKYIDEIQKQILHHVGGSQTSLQEDFTLINLEIQNFSKEIHKEIDILSSEKRMKGIITYLSDNVGEKFEQKLQAIEGRIKQIEQKDLAVTKQFKTNQMDTIFNSIRDCYHSIFVGIIKPVNRRKQTSRQQSMRSSRYSERLDP